MNLLFGSRILKFFSICRDVANVLHFMLQVQVAGNMAMLPKNLGGGNIMMLPGVATSTQPYRGIWRDELGFQHFSLLIGMWTLCPHFMLTRVST